MRYLICFVLGFVVLSPTTGSFVKKSVKGWLADGGDTHNVSAPAEPVALFGKDAPASRSFVWTVDRFYSPHGSDSTSVGVRERGEAIGVGRLTALGMKVGEQYRFWIDDDCDCVQVDHVPRAPGDPAVQTVPLGFVPVAR